MKTKDVVKILGLIIIVLGIYSAQAIKNASEYQPIYPKESYHKIKELHNKGLSEEEIAKELGFPLDLVTKYIKGEYIPPYADTQEQRKNVPENLVTKTVKHQENIHSNIPSEDSKLKFVTVEIPNYGRVTVREDMIVRDGDKVEIVLNKDYKEGGVITPIVERLPNVTYVTVETPYGPVQVPKETLEREGKEKIVEVHVEFMKQLEELKRLEKTNREIR